MTVFLAQTVQPLEQDTQYAPNTSMTYVNQPPQPFPCGYNFPSQMDPEYPGQLYPSSLYGPLVPGRQFLIPQLIGRSATEEGHEATAAVDAIDDQLVVMVLETEPHANHVTIPNQR